MEEKIMRKNKKIFMDILGVIVLCGMIGGVYAANYYSKGRETRRVQDGTKTVNSDTPEIVKEDGFAIEQDSDKEYLNISHADLVEKYSEEDKNVDDYSALTDFADYCFVGEVKDILYVQMDSSLQQEANTSGSPYTVYDIIVKENLKNKMEQGSRIKVLKKGGLLGDKETFELMEGDNIPEIGKFYVFSAAVQQIIR